MVKLLLLVLPLPLALHADVAGCACSPEKPDSMESRQCSLCREAEKHPAGLAVFFLKDNNPRKPNRWLILPRVHQDDGPQPLSKLTRAERTAVWEAAIEKGRELFGGDWGLALNGDLVRTQCHTHIHIGRLLKGVETRNFVVVNGPADIPVPKDGTGLWIHQAGNRLHVHLGEQTTETVLLR